MGQTEDIPFSETLCSCHIMCGHPYNLCRPFFYLPTLPSKHEHILDHQHDQIRLQVSYVFI